MLFWIKRVAIILGICTFFAVLLASLDRDDPLSFSSIGYGLLKGGAGAALFWFAGYVVADILLKGVVTDLDTDKTDLLEGGLLQRIFMHKERNLPGGEEMPLAEKRSKLREAPVLPKKGQG